MITLKIVWNLICRLNWKSQGQGKDKKDILATPGTSANKQILRYWKKTFDANKHEANLFLGPKYGNVIDYLFKEEFRCLKVFDKFHHIKIGQISYNRYLRINVSNKINRGTNLRHGPIKHAKLFTEEKFVKLK